MSLAALSPLLFTVFTNSVTIQLLSFYHVYAHVLQIYIRATPDSLMQVVDVNNRDLDI